MTPSPNPSSEELDEILHTYGEAVWDIVKESDVFADVGIPMVEAKRRLQSLIDAARKEVIDHVYKLSPKAQFKDWKPQDAFVFYERLKAYEQELSHPAPVHKSDKE